ncbi:putative DNA-binding domain-containing protein [Rhodoferax saidenbachensis]|uniref:DUF2063 domain-containing protein n=1 Tax=Rhodoferax saidenbachensis TaxID=1484693 RepID=A0A1P8KEY9_9BURK|nr:putative DNA-binding domain-containing protein [Rhodoferax saidenbachensis]APW44594.1 DUF2063 domain-containing protein [Rhodoferax saidenbachensis]
MSTLATQQQVLLDALFAWPAQNAMKTVAACAIDTGARGLKAYQTNGHVMAQRALQAAYPVLEQMLGEDSFADLARALWHAHPPIRGDLGLWGEALPVFLRGNVQLQSEPYLPDVAAAEWALHGCAGAADVPADLPSLAMLAEHDPQNLRIRLAPGCAVLQSAWPLASLLSAHREQTPSFEAVGQQVRDAVAQDVVVWREGLRPRVREALAGEAALLRSLLQGQCLAQALDEAQALDFGQWFPVALQSGLVLGATLMADNETTP